MTADEWRLEAVRLRRQQHIHQARADAPARRVRAGRPVGNERGRRHLTGALVRTRAPRWPGDHRSANVRVY
jgi:hypothetical protein